MKGFGRSSGQCLSSGAREAWHGSGLPSEMRDRPKTRSPFQRADRGNEPIMRLPKLPTFLLPARWCWGGLYARMKLAGKGDKSKSCRAGSPRYECFPGQELDSSPFRLSGGDRVPPARRASDRLQPNVEPMARVDDASSSMAFVGSANVQSRAARSLFSRVGNAPRAQ